MLFAALALAGEPVSTGPATGPTVPGLDADVTFAWSEVGFSPAGPEEVAFGPDDLALGSDGAWAFWDPVELRVHASSGDFDLGVVTSLALAPDGDVLVLDEKARTVTRWSGGVQLAETPMDRLCPTGVALLVDGDELDGVDLFGNLHPLADLTGGGLDRVDGPHLRAPAHVAKVSGGALTVDGAPLAAPSDTLAGRLVGDWVLVEAGEKGHLRTRLAISLTTGRRVTLPLTRDGRYRPANGVAAGTDGSLAWLDPRSDALHLVRVTP